MLDTNKRKESMGNAAEAGQADAAFSDLPYKPEYVYVNNQWEEIGSTRFNLYRQQNPEDWWIAYDNAAPHKYQIAVQCIARQEELYFKEWVEHHLKIGIEHIYIYDNNDECGLEEFLRGQLSEKDFSMIEVIPWRKPMPLQQHGALIDCLKNHKDDVKWLLSIDLDEFLILEKPMNEFLDEFSYASQVYFSWESIGADGQLYYEDKPLSERFKKRFDCEDLGQGKVMVRPERLKHWHIHGARLRQGKTVNVLHKKINAPASFANIYEVAWIKHYFTKSLEEWTNKMKRGCADNLYCRRYAVFFDINPDLKKYYNPDVLQVQPHGNPPKGEIPKQ